MHAGKRLTDELRHADCVLQLVHAIAGYTEMLQYVALGIFAHPTDRLLEQHDIKILRHYNIFYHMQNILCRGISKK